MGMLNYEIFKIDCMSQRTFYRAQHAVIEMSLSKYYVLEAMNSFGIYLEITSMPSFPFETV